MSGERPAERGGAAASEAAAPEAAVAARARQPGVKAPARRQPAWTFASVVTLLCGLANAYLHWYLVMNEAMWPYIVFELIPGVLGLVCGVYAIYRYDSKVAWVGLLLALSPLITWLSV
ncbi:hypothetical protein [Bordetella genomosp. 5]|uniref:hypothetical protein n=1 Tax=Bordetella genomosp. 5 TaxID=1395608 RepID=UPI0020CDCB18|nr:hypothetical protein [Bordetella genomosp. 5]